MMKSILRPISAAIAIGAVALAFPLFQLEAAKEERAQKAKAERATHKKVQAHKFSKKNPTAYLSSAAWHNLTDEQKVAAREARKKAGIKSKQSRRVGMLLTNPGGSKVDPPDEEVAMKPPAKNGTTKPDEMDTTDDDSDSSNSEMDTSDDESSSDDDSSMSSRNESSSNDDGDDVEVGVSSRGRT